MIDQDKLKESFDILEKIYSQIPATKGCERANTKNGCRGWCCIYNFPSMFNCEFFYLWQNFVANSIQETVKEVVFRAIRSYLQTSVTKSCVFFDRSSCKCLCHKWRPLSCRLYGLIHQKSWKKRVKRVKDLYRNFPKSDTRDMKKSFEQCEIVRTLNNKKHVSPKDEDMWFKASKEAERTMGVPNHIVEMHDAPEGSYRAVHDYVLMNIFDDNFMKMLSTQREERPSNEQIDAFLGAMKNNFNNKEQNNVGSVGPEISPISEHS